MWPGKLFGKGTWIGLGVAVTALLLWVMLGALLLTGGVLPSSVQELWLLAGCLLALLVGGTMAVKRGGERLSALMVALLLYVLLWVVALASNAPLDFQSRGLKITACVLCGGLLPALPRKRGRQKKRGKRKPSSPSRRR